MFEYKHRDRGLAVCLLYMLIFLCMIQPACVTVKSETLPTGNQNSRKLILPGEYDPNNMLARAARGEIPVAMLYEDRYVLAFLGERPYAKGHFLVISKTSKARNILELEPEELARIMAVVKKVAQAEMTVIGAEGFSLRQNNGSASTISQFHLHVIPRWKGDQMNEIPQAEVSVTALEPLAKQIRAAIKN